MSTMRAPTATSGLLVLADISGYTSFLQEVTVAHKDDAFADGKVPDAYTIISTLLDGIVRCLVPPFTFSKFEGDAVFAYATAADPVPSGDALLASLRACYGVFRDQVESAQDVWPCWCDACKRIEMLDLKFVLHAGVFVIQEISGRHELVGPEVVVAHRLLKPAATELSGAGGFGLVTEAAASRAELASDSAVSVVETFEHYSPITALVFRFGGDRAASTPG